jgi:hypothetical protein
VIEAIRHGEGKEFGQGEGSMLGEEDLVKVEVEQFDESMGEIVILRGLEADGEGLTTGIDDLVNLFGKVVCFVLVGGDVGIAGETESGVGRDFFAGKKGGTEVGHEVFEKDKASFIDKGDARDGGREGEDDNAFVFILRVEDGEGETDLQGGNDLAGIFRSEEKGREEGSDV